MSDLKIKAVSNADTAKAIKDYIIISFGTLIVAAAVFFFMMPSNLAVGSISGLAIVLKNIIPLGVAEINFILNVALLIFGFITIGREFGAKTVYTSLLMPGFLAVFERIFPENPSLTGDPFLDMTGYIFIVSIGLAILFSRNASSGGLDIVAKFLNKYFHLELGTAMALPGICVALTSVFFYDTKTAFISVLGTYLNGVVLDQFMLGLNIKKRICIITEKEEDVIAFLVRDLNCGATLYDVMGAYDKKKRKEIITIVNRNDYAKIVDRMPKIDPHAFMTVYNLNEVQNGHRMR